MSRGDLQDRDQANMGIVSLILNVVQNLCQKADMCITSAIRPLRRGATKELHLIWHIKKKHSKEYNKFTQAIQAKAPKQQTLLDTYLKV